MWNGRAFFGKPGNHRCAPIVLTYSFLCSWKFTFFFFAVSLSFLTIKIHAFMVDGRTFHVFIKKTRYISSLPISICFSVIAKYRILTKHFNASRRTSYLPKNMLMSLPDMLGNATLTISTEGARA